KLMDKKWQNYRKKKKKRSYLDSKTSNKISEKFRNSGVSSGVTGTRTASRSLFNQQYILREQQTRKTNPSCCSFCLMVTIEPEGKKMVRQLSSRRPLSQ
ncbi:hypothetical protein, partial [Vibrio cholerae]|uniref:hypothetical protein n=1 Tax=Vibrio cholerae TaxID=666 RepID=UPI0030806D79